MSEIYKDRDGSIYKLDGDLMPPPSIDIQSNRQFYWLANVTKVINNLLDRVYELEKKLETDKNIVEEPLATIE